MNAKRGKQILAGVVLVLALLFVFLNWQATTIRFLFWKVSLSLSLALAIVFVLGVVLGWLGSIFYMTREH